MTDYIKLNEELLKRIELEPITEMSNFRKKVITTEGLRELNEFSKSSSKRPARLYTFDNIKLNSKRAHFIKKGGKQ